MCNRAVEGLSKKRSLATFLFLSTSAATAIYYWFTTTKWWIADDPAILKFSAQYPLLQSLFSPQVWQRFSPSNLTPMVILSFKLDLSAFGLNPSGFYLHQLLVVWLISFLLFLLLQRYVNPLVAAATSVFLLLSPPMTQCVSLLMTRHYLEGLALCTLSLLFYSWHLERGGSWRLGLSVALYAVSTLCKEVFVPLPLVVALWPRDIHERDGDSMKRRAKRVAPFFLWLILYATYRRWMLGKFIGGYGSLAASFSTTALLERTYQGLFSGNTALFLLCTALFLVLGVHLSGSRSRERVSLSAAVLLSILMPLMAISNLVSERHLLLPAFALTVAIAFGADAILKRDRPWYPLLSATLVSLLLCLAIPAHLAARKRLAPLTASFAATGRFLWFKSTPDDAVLNPTIPNWYFDGLRWLKREVANQGPCGLGLSNLCYAAILGGYKDQYRLWEYDSSQEKVKPLPRTEAEKRVKTCLSTFRKGELTARIWESHGTVHWRFGPYQEGRYFLVDRETGYPYPLPRDGLFPATLASLSLEEKRLAVCYEAPKGWKTCTTPEISKTPPRGG